VLSLWIFSRTKESPYGNFVVLAFLIVQALDGALTYVGLATVGQVAEGNPLLAGLMAVPLAADTPTADTPGDNPSSEKSKGYMTADGIYVPPDSIHPCARTVTQPSL